MTTQAEAKAVCAALGFSFRKTPLGEYRAMPRNGTEEQAIYETDLDCLLATVRAEAARRQEGGGLMLNDRTRVQPWGPGMSPKAKAALAAWRAEQPRDPAPETPEPEVLIPPGRGLHVALAIAAAYASRPPLPPGAGRVWRQPPAARPYGEESRS